MRILIVEDSRINQYIARDTLLKFLLDCEIEFAMDGEEALEMIYTQPIDLVLLDIIMPKLTGLQVLEQLNKASYKHLPKVIMLTTISDAKILKACFDQGATDYIKKPFEEMDFISRINSALREIKNEQALKRNAELLETQNIKLIEANESLKLAQYHLVQKEKLVAIGELAAGIAHEINNPLAFVTSNFTNVRQYVSTLKTFLEQLYATLESDESVLNQDLKVSLLESWERNDLAFILDDFPELIIDSQKGLDRVAKIVSSMRNFARLSDDEYFEYVYIADLFEEVFIVVNNEVKYSANIITDFPECPPIYCNKGQIEQILVNLLVNAAHAIKNQIHDGMGTIRIHTIPHEDACEIIICDNGTGIKEAHLSKIFDPFFTTKPEGQGTGLGLSITHNIVVDKHHGRIHVDSQWGNGACFHIFLPYKIDIE